MTGCLGPCGLAAPAGQALPGRRCNERGDTVQGIGAACSRKEDLRFLTGRGQYTDDINRPGQTHA